MAEGKLEPRDINWRQWLPWTHLFRGFWIAIDLKKLFLAAVGLLVMSVGWWLLASIFYGPRKAPDWSSGSYESTKENEAEVWAKFKEDRREWNFFLRAAGPTPEWEDANDLAQSP